MASYNEKYSNPDWIGQKFNRLTVINVVRDRDVSGRSQIRWKLRCDCGKEILLAPYKAVSGTQKSCGCLAREEAKERATIHGESHTRLFYIWVSMRDRCNNPKNKRYDRYGGRGIKVCDEWQKEYAVFATWAREHGYSDELTIDRIDVNGNYEPSNCRWVDLKTQERNRTDNRLITIGDETKTLAEWCEIYGNNYGMVYNRIANLGWDAEKAIKTPSGGTGANQTTYHPELAKKPVQRKYHIQNRYVVIDGETLPLKAACERLGLPYKAVHLRVTRYGMTVEEAISTPFKDNSNSMRKRAERAGLPYQTVMQRIRTGWSEEKALATPLMRKKSEKK